VALEAAITALHRFRELEFVFAGAWEAEVDRAQALAQLRDCEVANRIHFVGTVVAEEKHRLLLASDFLVFPPTKPEGHPRVLLEAMAAGLPVITTDQGAIVETVAEGKTGFIVEPGNAAAIVDRITFLIEHPDARRCMGQAARERFLAHYTAEASNARLAALFAEVLSQA
jgi:glycosyltransferase involved in cell wall biosynthesis